MKTASSPYEPAIFRLPQPDDWVENYGGYVVALAVGILAFSYLYATKLHIPRPPEIEPTVRMILRPIPPKPEEEEKPPEEQKEGAPEVEENVATFVPEEVEEAVPDEPEPAEPVTIESWVPQTEAERERLNAVIADVQNYRDRLEVKETEIKAEINKRVVESKGREFLLNSDGGKAGVIRTLDVSGFPEDLVVKVFNRYGITIEHRNVRLDEANRSYLNTATTESGTFTSVQHEGFYEVFVLSPKAVAYMSALETQALTDGGHNPRTTRVRKITFGIVKQEDPNCKQCEPYILGVVDMEVERIR